MASRATKRCKDIHCGATAPNHRVFPLEKLPPQAAALVAREHISAFDVIECLYCFSVSAGRTMLGHRKGAFGSPGAEEMIWLDETALSERKGSRE